MKQSIPAAIGPYVVILLLSGYLYYQAFQISTTDDGQLGADVWPKTILFFPVLTCAWEIVRKLLFQTEVSASKLPPIVPPMDTGKASNVGPWTPWIGIALTAAYVLIFSELGYFLATCLFVTAFIYFGNYRRPVMAVAIGVVASLVFVFIFMEIVYVSLPIGVGPFADLSALIMSTMGIK